MRTTATTILLGAGTSIGVGSSIAETTITNNPETDLILKIIIPVLTGVLIPFLNDLREEMRARRIERREKKQAKQNARNRPGTTQ